MYANIRSASLHTISGTNALMKLQMLLAQRDYTKQFC